MNQTAGARYGIWGIDPYGTDVGTIALKTANGVSDLFTKHYANKLEAAKARGENVKAQELERTLETGVSSKNAQNRALEKYFPMQEAGKVGLNNAQIGEIRERTGVYGKQGGLYDAEANRARAQANLLGTQASGVMGDNQWIKDQRSAASRGGKGAIFYDPATGQYVSSPTLATTTTAQSALAGAQRVTPLIDNMIKELPQFQGLKGKAKLGAAKVGNYLGLEDSDLPSQEAKGLADLALSAEGMVKAWGIRPTDKTLETMKQAVIPLEGETGRGYKERLITTLQELEALDQQSADILREGQDVSPGVGGSGGMSLMGGVQQPGMSPMAQPQRGVMASPPQVQQSMPELSHIPDDELRRIAGGG